MGGGWDGRGWDEIRWNEYGWKACDGWDEKGVERKEG